MKRIVLAVLGFNVAMAAIPMRLVSNLPSPQPVGSVIGFMPRVDPLPPATYTFRYLVSTAHGPFHVVRDFSQNVAFQWTPELYEHEARIRVVLRNNATQETSEAEAPFQIVSRVKGSHAVVTPTSHPLVALFSAAACAEGSNFRVAFRRQDKVGTNQTPPVPCRGTVSNNTYIAGMRADSVYEMRSEVVNGGKVQAGEWIPFHTGILDGSFPQILTETPRVSQAAAEGIIIRSMVDPWRNTATDLDGGVVWYLNSPSAAFLTRVLPGGRFLVLADGSNSVNTTTRQQLIREVDLLGNTIKETNISVLAEKLEAHGIKSDCKTGGKECVPGFHHEAIRLPNGHTLVLAGLERMFPAGTQGAKGPVDVLGDLVLDLDEDFQLAWFWNSFDHMDLKRASLGKETCKVGPGSDGCTAVFLAPEANGWLHSNALYFDKRSGDILISIPEQDWVIKVDYKSGKGTGKVLWRLGSDGDFTVKSDDPYPWFSYQHDAGFDPDSGLLVLFDDGHRRKDKFPKANNRGQTWKIDEDSKTATLMLNADVGVYAIAVGSAQPLSDGGYTFESGFINPGPAGLAATYSLTTETSVDGKITYTQRVNGALTYRSFRVANMYSAPRK